MIENFLKKSSKWLLKLLVNLKENLSKLIEFLIYNKFIASLIKNKKKPTYKKVGMGTHHKKNKENKSSRTQVVKEHNN